MCDVHRQGEVLWDIAKRFNGLGLLTRLLPDEEGCAERYHHAGLPPSGRLVYLPFVWGRRDRRLLSPPRLQSPRARPRWHEEDWMGARKEDPTENPVADGETLVRFWMPASDPAAADSVIGFFEAGNK